MKLLAIILLTCYALFAQSSIPKCVSINIKAEQYKISYGSNAFDDHTLNAADSTYISLITNDYGTVWAIELKEETVTVTDLNGNVVLNSVYRQEENDYLQTRFNTE